MNYIDVSALSTQEMRWEVNLYLKKKCIENTKTDLIWQFDWESGN